MELLNESAKITIKIHRIPIEMDENEIKKAISPYRTVESRIDQLRDLPYTCYNDIKLIRMELRKAIPSYLMIGNKQFLVIYIGQNRTCRKCGSTEHKNIKLDR